VRKLLNLRKRLSKIRVFDPACGSGNFLVIAYKEMRAIEFEVNKRRGETHLKSEIPLTNFRGIELRDFPAEIARLALIIAEYQCDERYRGQKEALVEFLPLDTQNWIVCGNALRLDWLSLCPPTGKGVKLNSGDLFQNSFHQAEVDFRNEGGETYICGNPPYAGKGKKASTVLEDMDFVIGSLTKSYGYVDYAGCWFVRASQYLTEADGTATFVCTNSISQGQQVPQLWPLVLQNGIEIQYANLSFKWSNSALNNAGVTCVVISISRSSTEKKFITDEDNKQEVENINPYLIPGKTIYLQRSSKPISDELPGMETGIMLNDGGNLLFSPQEYRQACTADPAIKNFSRRIMGAQEFLQGQARYCLNIKDDELGAASLLPEVVNRLDKVVSERKRSKKANTRDVLSKHPHRYEYASGLDARIALLVPTVSSERRYWLPVGMLENSLVIAPNYALYDCGAHCLSILSSRLHLAWIATVCGKLETRYRYSNSLGWNIFPIPSLTQKNKEDLTQCAEDILLAREAYFPATIADLYKPDEMPENLRAAHDRNDEVLERIYIGRRFKNDTERLEKLFELYTKMTEAKGRIGGDKIQASAEATAP
jgi:hypothetical protein